MILPDAPEIELGPIPRGASSVFVEASRAYRYAGFRVTAAGRELLLQPIDYVGERALPRGDHTYVLNRVDGRLTCDLDSS